MSFGYVYILRCADNSLYTGWCKNLEKRVDKHNKGLGAKYTKSRKPCKLVFYKEISSKSEALKIEFRIKKLKKVYKENIVKNFKKKELFK